MKSVLVARLRGCSWTGVAVTVKDLPGKVPDFCTILLAPTAGGVLIWAVTRRGTAFPLSGDTGLIWCVGNTLGGLGSLFLYTDGLIAAAGSCVIPFLVSVAPGPGFVFGLHCNQLNEKLAHSAKCNRTSFFFLSYKLHRTGDANGGAVCFATGADWFLIGGLGNPSKNDEVARPLGSKNILNYWQIRMNVLVLIICGLAFTCFIFILQIHTDQAGWNWSTEKETTILYRTSSCIWIRVGFPK